MEDREYSSDTDDDDYIPSDGSEVSEELSDAAVEEGEGESTVESKKGKKRRKKSSSATKRKRSGGIKLDDEKEQEPAKEEPVAATEKILTEEDQKKHSDSLWQDFLKDVETPVRTKLSTTPTVAKPALQTPARGTPTSTLSNPQGSTPAAANKITVTKVFDFAGEEIRVTEDVDINSKEGQQAMARTPMTPVTQPTNGSAQKPAGTPSTPMRSGLSNIVGLISGKKNKMSTLTKSNLDWKAFKEEEGIEDELQQHNKGKDGYLDRQAFLQRADLNQFEIEKSLRASNRSHR